MTALRKVSNISGNLVAAIVSIEPIFNVDCFTLTISASAFATRESMSLI